MVQRDLRHIRPRRREGSAQREIRGAIHQPPEQTAREQGHGEQKNGREDRGGRRKAQAAELGFQPGRGRRRPGGRPRAPSSYQGNQARRTSDRGEQPRHHRTREKQRAEQDEGAQHHPDDIRDEHPRSTARPPLAVLVVGPAAQQAHQERGRQQKRTQEHAGRHARVEKRETTEPPVVVEQQARETPREEASRRAGDDDDG